LGFGAFRFIFEEMMPKGIVITLAAVLELTFASSGEQIFFQENFENGLDSGWKKVEFEGETSHRILKEGSNAVLNASAQSSASGLAIKLNRVRPQSAILSWRWKIDRIPEGGSDDKIQTFDHTARVFVAFKTLVGPPRTINYVWANELVPGRTFHHPNSGRSRFIVLQSGNSGAGKWIAEKRDIAADWKQLFGGGDVPDIVAIGFMTDSDGTKTNVTGWYDDFKLGSRD
jgi:hypothetical protein